MKHIIITGSTKGIGYHLNSHLAGPESTLHLIARSEMEEQKQQLEQTGCSVFTYQADLSDTENTENLADQIFGNIPQEKTENVVLVSNAGTLHPVGPLGRHDTNDFRDNLELNFVAPALLSHLFVKKLKPFTCDKRIIFISSGASKRPYAGWSHYCSTKAGTDMLMECIALEQQNEDNPVRVMAYNPGRTETGMQSEIRRQNQENFPAVDSFIQAREEGKLNDPADVAKHIAGYIHTRDFPAGRIVNFMPD